MMCDGILNGYIKAKYVISLKLVIMVMWSAKNLHKGIWMIDIKLNKWVFTKQEIIHHLLVNMFKWSNY